MTEYKLMIKVHLITGLKYLCITKRKDYESYHGSGRYWVNHLKKYGKFVHTILIFKSFNYEEFISVCKEYSEFFNVVKSDEYANLIPESGYGEGDTNNFVMFWKTASHERKMDVIRRRNQSIKNTHELNGTTDERNFLISEAQKRIWDNLSESQKIERISKFREGLKNYLSNAENYEKWITKLKEAKKEYFNTVDPKILSDRNRRARLNTSEESKIRRREKIKAVYASGKHDEFYSRISKERKGTGNPNAKIILWYGKEYTKGQFKKAIGKLDDPNIRKMFDEREDCSIQFEIKSIEYKQITCPHCGKVGNNVSSFKRWHFNNCKRK